MYINHILRSQWPANDKHNGKSVEVVGYVVNPQEAGVSPNMLPLVLLRVPEGEIVKAFLEDVFPAPQYDERELLLQAAGYQARDNGFGSGWYALVPGEKQMIHHADYHNYVGFFSRKEDLLDEVSEAIITQAENLPEFPEGADWDHLEIHKKLMLSAAAGRAALERRDQDRAFVAQGIATTIASLASKGDSFMDTLNAGAVLHGISPELKHVEPGEFRFNLANYVAAYLAVQFEKADLNPAFIAKIDKDIVLKAIVQFEEAALDIQVLEKAVELEGYTIADSDLGGFYFEVGNYCSEDFVTQEEAIRAAYTDLVTPEQERERMAPPMLTPMAA